MKKIHLYLIYKRKHWISIFSSEFTNKKQTKKNTTVAQNNGPGNDYQGHGHNF